MSANEKPGPYSIGSNHWPGLSKLVEEAGEVQQVVGKLLGSGGETKHWDGTDLKERLHDEIADLIAACMFVVEANGLDEERVHGRIRAKRARFREWHGNPVSLPDFDSEAPFLPNSVRIGSVTVPIAGGGRLHRSALPPEMVARGIERVGPNGNIDNCALANDVSESGCQVCSGRCPDFARLVKPF